MFHQRWVSPNCLWFLLEIVMSIHIRCGLDCVEVLEVRRVSDIHIQWIYNASLDWLQYGVGSCLGRSQCPVLLRSTWSVPHRETMDCEETTDGVTSQGATKHREDPTRLSSICNGTFHYCLWWLVACSGRKQWPWQIESSWIRIFKESHVADLWWYVPGRIQVSFQ